jgi:hypothetical protein
MELRAPLELKKDLRFSLLCERSLLESLILEEEIGDKVFSFLMLLPLMTGARMASCAEGSLLWRFRKLSLLRLARVDGVSRMLDEIVPFVSLCGMIVLRLSASISDMRFLLLLSLRTGLAIAQLGVGVSSRCC